MNWLASIGVGVCSAPLTAIIIGTAAGLCADWLRVPQREGAAGFFVVAVALLGAIAGLVLGIVVARGGFGVQVGFGKALGLTLAASLAVSLVVTGLVWLTADHAPKVDGRRLEIAVELRTPPGALLPPESEPHYVAFTRLSDGRSMGSANLNLEKAQAVDGRYVIPATLPIETGSSRKLLNIQYGNDRSLMFAVNFGSKPQKKDFKWSDWIEAARKMGEERPSSDKAFAMRYEVRLVEPPPPPPTREEAEAAVDANQEAEMRALAPDAPLAQWLVYTRYGVPQARIDSAAAAIRARPNFVQELTHEMLDGEYEASRDAMRVIEHIKPPPTELKDAVATAGRDIAEAIRQLPLNPTEEELRTYGTDVSTYFSAWMVATRALQGRDGVDFVPQLQEIIEPARQRQQSHIVRIGIVRVASFYLHTWGGIEPLPTDPPPK